MFKWWVKTFGRGPLSSKFLEHLAEYFLGIHSRGVVDLETLSIDKKLNSEGESTTCPYQPITYAAFFTLMQYVDVSSEKDAFLDIGCGKGRALVCAGTYPFKRIVGIDLSAELISRANKNITSATSKLVCKEIHAEIADATTYQIRSDVTHIFLYNPFIGDTLLKVIENIESSLAESPRKLELIYVIPDWTSDLFEARSGWKRKVELDLYTSDAERGRIYVFQP